MDLLTNWLWQSAVVVLAAAVTLGVMPRLGARWRYIVWAFTLVAILTLPLLGVVASILPLHGGPLALTAADDVPLVAIPESNTFDRIAVALMLTWMAWRSFRLCTAMLWLRRAKRSCSAAPEELEQRLACWTRVRATGRRARLMLSDEVHAAAVLGLGSPVIALSPALVAALTDEELDRVVMHEWAHVQRWDDYSSLAQCVAGVVAGWHPAVWLSGRLVNREREAACDESAVAATGNARDYAASLVRVADVALGGRDFAAAPGVLSGSGLRHRVSRVMAMPRVLGTASAAVLTAATSVGVLLLTVSVGSVAIVGYAIDDLALLTPRALPIQLAPLRSPSPVADPQALLSLEADPSQTADTPILASRPMPPAKHPIGLPEHPEPSPGDTAVTVATASDSSIPVLMSHATAAPLAASPVAADNESTPGWSRAAEAGHAIGRSSEQAGAATGRFFSRLAGKVARSF